MTVEEKKGLLKMYRTSEAELSAITAERFKLLGIQNSIGLSEKAAELSKRIWLSDDALVINASKLMEKREKITVAFDLLEGEILKSVLKRRYILGHSFEKIAEDLDYSWRHILRLHKEALEKLDI